MKSQAIAYADLDFEELWRAAPRFWRRLAQTGASPRDECWLWRGATMTAGYGEMSFAGRKIGAHRFSFLLLAGPLGAGLCVLHRCHERRCVNPAHLYQGTYHDNWLDMRRRAPDVGPPPSWEFL